MPSRSKAGCWHDSTGAVMPRSWFTHVAAWFGVLLLSPLLWTHALSKPEGAQPGASLAGQLLVASPDMGDPRFRQTVILMVQHNQDGALGIVINRPAEELSLAKLLEALGLDSTGIQGQVRIFAGGPVEPQSGFVVHSTDYHRTGTIDIDGRVAMTSSPEVLRDIGHNEGPGKKLVAFGYAGWGPGQLEGELALDAWFTVPERSRAGLRCGPAKALGRTCEAPHHSTLRQEYPMPALRRITAYTDYKSPYAYLAKDLTYELERDLPVRVEWLPYALDIPSFLGSARLDAEGRVVEEQRNAHQWRRVRYSYMDCRRVARKRGLVIRGPLKIWDSTLAAAGMLYAQRAGDTVFRRYHDAVFERFWKRELDIEDVAVIAAVLTEAGADGDKFAAYASTGRDEVAAISRAAEATGVFGVPSFVLDGELFWGREHLPDIRAMLAG